MPTYTSENKLPEVCLWQLHNKADISSSSIVCPILFSIFLFFNRSAAILPSSESSCPIWVDLNAQQHQDIFVANKIIHWIMACFFLDCYLLLWVQPQWHVGWSSNDRTWFSGPYKLDLFHVESGQWRLTTFWPQHMEGCLEKPCISILRKKEDVRFIQATRDTFSLEKRTQESQKRFLRNVFYLFIFMYIFFSVRCIEFPFDTSKLWMKNRPLEKYILG
jgi:hypothetical protein